MLQQLEISQEAQDFDPSQLDNKQVPEPDYESSD